MSSETYRGTISRTFFTNPDGPAMAGVMQTDGGKTVRFAGKLAANVGDKVEMTGEWTTHPQYGKQFVAETGRVQMDESPDAMAQLLASHSSFKGLGPARARKVVDAALSLSTDGEAASALVAFPAAVAARAGVDISIVETASKLWGERKGYFDALAQLVDQGWSNAQAQRIVSKLGENSASLVKSDPYMLIGKIKRFGFRTVDVVARKIGFSATDPFRLAAGVAYCLDRIAEDGNTWTTREGLLGESVNELRPDTLDGEDKIRETIQHLIDVGIVYTDTAPSGEEIVASAELARIEIDVFERLLAKLAHPADASATGGFSLEGPRSQAMIVTLNGEQKLAAWGVWMHSCAVISGGAGVGKTYTMKAICEIAEENLLKVELCAPTGKAARKLSHATSRDAKTIHRLLEPQFDDGNFIFGKNAKNKIDADLVVIDEFSMVDVRLARSLLIALPEECRILIVGDHNQIPSVGPGAILRDILDARSTYPGSVHVLKKIVRQAGILARNTTALLDGVVVKQSDCAWGIESTTKGHEIAAAALVADFVESIVTSPERLEPFGRFLDFAWDIQVLAPMRKGPLGTWSLNVHLQRLRQRLLGNMPPEVTPEGKAPKPMVGDRVIWTKNDYELNLFNGTQALVVAFAKGGAIEILTEDGREVTVPASKRFNIEVAYAMTIHKSQGSEWPLVVLIASSSHWIMHDRNLLYTGASRAAESLTIVGDSAGLRHFAQEKASERRQTFGGYLVHGWSPKAQAPQAVVEG